MSAKELLHALTTLQNLNEQPPEELELSFSQASHSFFNTAQANNQMDFELYMAIKNNPNEKKKPKQTKINQNPNKIQPRKSLTPRNVK